jgi:hypothetical protein
MNDFIEMYKKGAITADHLVLECLHLIDPANPEVVLRSLPRDIISRIVKLAAHYQRDRMITNYGNLPTDEQVAAAAEWIRRARPEHVANVAHTHKS